MKPNSSRSTQLFFIAQWITVINDTFARRILASQLKQNHQRLMMWLVLGIWLWLGLALPATVQAQDSTAAETTVTPGSPAEITTHTVAVGETLSLIALRYDISVEALMAINAITDPDSIYIGQELALPPGTELQPAPTPLPTHEVQPGETLSGIALRYDITLARLMAFNGMSDADAVIVGQSLRIPPPLDADGEPIEDVATTVPTEVRLEERSPVTATVVESTELADEEATATQAPVKTSAVTSTPTPSPTSSPTPMATATPTATPTPFILIPDTSLEDTLVHEQTASLNRTYEVDAGDTLTRIALRTGVNRDALRQLNRLGPEADVQLFVGQILLLPAAGDDLRVQQSEQEYVIQPGDSLGAISEQFGLSLAELLSANRLADPNNISVGQRLVIPPPTTAGSSAESSMAERAKLVGPVQNGYYYYTVQPGDTISELAAAFDSTKLAIFEYNNSTLPDQETVYSGLEIRIPFGPPDLPTRHPPVPTSGSSFLVSLSRQQCWLFHGDAIAYEWTCSTGYGEWITRVGSFAVQSKIENAQSRAYALDMPYWLGIYDVGPFENGIHGLPVEWATGNKLWEGLIGEPATFGCAMLNDDDAAVLFDAAYIGMPVHITN